MGAPQFTPGPWEVAGRYGPDGWRVGARGYDIATALYLGGTDPAHANARLIATAPELYQEVEFLCARLRELETMILDDEVGNEYYGHVAPSRARLEMLLQKARGESDQ